MQLDVYSRIIRYVRSVENVNDVKSTSYWNQIVYLKKYIKDQMDAAADASPLQVVKSRLLKQFQTLEQGAFLLVGA